VHYYYYGLYIPSCKAGLSFSYHMEIRLVRLLSYHLIFSVSKNWAGLVVFLYYFHGTLSKRAGGTPVAPLAGWLAKLCQKKNGGKDNKGGDAPKEARAHLSPGLLARRTIRRCRACLQENNQIKGWSWLQGRSHTACCEPSSTSPSMHAVHGFQRRSRNSSLSFSTIQHALTEQNKRRDE
jgi:hypothetical protein